MNFERGQAPMDSLKIGLEANCVEIYEIRYNVYGPKDENIDNVLKKYENGIALKWSISSREFYEKKWEFKTHDKNWQEFSRYRLSDFSGMRIQYKGTYYKIPVL